MKNFWRVIVWAGATIAVTTGTLLAIRYVGPLQRLAGIVPADKQVVS